MRIGNNPSHLKLISWSPQRDNFVAGVLALGKVKFSKGELKRFIHLVFKQFPNAYSDSVLLNSF